MQSDISEQQVDRFQDVEPAFERPGMRCCIVDWSVAGEDDVVAVVFGHADEKSAGF